jgi:hypothetical protein
VSVLDDPRVSRVGYGYTIQTGHGTYWTEEDDRDQPPTWRAYTGCDGEWIGQTGDPLASDEAASAKYGSAEDVVTALLACDGKAVAQ